ncbi:acid-sensing ion channel 2-like [Tubulanus polymorphus]|uniref:acid-sensing ion channel 2-like n=1 Tax=Tubulanus polymorphus TaxID=672921 RepID=UPI003DA581C1
MSIVDFSQESSVHGIKYVGCYDTAVIRKVIWCLMIIASIVFCICMIHPRVLVYMRKPVSTKITIEYESPMEFPAVTICNLNTLRKSYLMSDPVLRIIAENPPTPNFKVQYDNATLQAFKNYKYETILREGGHLLNKFMFQCYWLNRKINCSDYFDDVLTSYGRCYTFNSRKYVQRNGKPLEVTTSGSDQGLWVRINVQQYENAISSGASAGIKVLVHDQNEVPLVREFGFAVQPGVEALAALSSQRLNFLPAPYEGGHCKNMSDPNVKNPLKYFPTYSHSSCQRECRLVALFKTCNCSLYVNDSKYQVQVTTAMVPSNLAAELLRNVINQSTTSMRENFLEMRVYYKQLVYDHIRQQPEYSWQQLIADVGGQLGFCIGASILSLYEIVEFLAMFLLKLWTSLRSKTRRVTDIKPQHTKEMTTKT